ncbi:AAA-domain-containing protein [Phellopilus nigrolimitatus]|nr:AAA-domain-containing protein [Phellopilus nigrolimitatus]
MARSVTDAPGIGVRRSTRTRKSSDSFVPLSGSEHSAGDASSPTNRNSKKKRRLRDEDDEGAEYEDEETIVKKEVEYTTSRGRTTRKVPSYRESDDDGMNLFEDDADLDVVDHPKKPSRISIGRVNSDDEGEVSIGHYKANSTSVSPPAIMDANDVVDAPLGRITRATSKQFTKKNARQLDDEDGYDATADHDAPGSSEEEPIDEDVQTTPSPEPELEEESGPKQYSGVQGPGWSANGTVLSRYMGMPGPADDTDSDAPTRTPRKQFGAGAGGGVFAAGGGGLFPDGLATMGTPSNLGKVSDAALADADPLGINPNVTFDEVGGLDDHINSLKEMTLLPLLYPEVFQRFSLTPPRGVLFHGPPGTGKTLLARALAASCRSNGKGISFFMRKGADCLSKWVGEAERQLRLLFEEARNQQPSIIFFDEIDGLAPVRSSKQDQIHSSIVSTLLALMDGMDGRGQVIVIGATNRPDAVDPALRRPGRFDREFYFALPNLDARAKILSIITRKWEGWDDDRAKETVQRLAKITKGYGGADLRALCTEAALNAVQRRYPQIYKSMDRLLLKPETIGVQARDFMISVKKLVPSSARSTASSATPLPSQLVPLLDDTLQRVKVVLEKRTALEEAEYEDEGDEGALEREILMQKMESLRVYRPRVVLHGEAGMGQGYIGSAALHHLEGFHIQTLDLGSLLGDSTRTIEAGIVQLFIEAKRHQPSVVHIPSLLGWCAAVSETARTTVKAMLDTLSPSEPVLLLAVVDGPLSSLPRDVRSWFGVTKDNRVLFSHPDTEKRRNAKKRVLEELPIAPPLEPRQPSAAELAVQEENDQRILTLLKYRLGPILAELKRKHKRFTKHARDEYNLHPENQWDPFLGHAQPAVQAPVNAEIQTNGVIVVDGEGGLQPNVQVNGIHVQPPEPRLYEVDLESMNADLYKGKYLTPNMFLDEIGKMVYNAEVRAYEDRDRLNKAQAMFTAAQVSIQEFDPGFRLECERMAGRERKRREQRRAEKGKSRAENGAPVRRSARNYGLQPEHGITDPLLLERRLKRQHPAGNWCALHRTVDDMTQTPSRTNTSNGHFFPQAHLTPITEVNSEPRHAGFDPNLLNPLSPQLRLPSVQSLIAAESSNGLPVASSSSVGFEQNFLANNAVDSNPHTPPADNTEPLNILLDPSLAPEETSPVPMEIERPRTPSPPPPPFHVDETLLTELEAKYVSETEQLNVEQLEQLRATSLNCIWRHRQEWDRDACVHELFGVISDFAEEAALDDFDED